MTSQSVYPEKYAIWRVCPIQTIVNVNFVLSITVNHGVSATSKKLTLIIPLLVRVNHAMAVDWRKIVTMSVKKMTDLPVIRESRS